MSDEVKLQYNARQKFSFVLWYACKTLAILVISITALGAVVWIVGYSRGLQSPAMSKLPGEIPIMLFWAALFWFYPSWAIRRLRTKARARAAASQAAISN